MKGLPAYASDDPALDRLEPDELRKLQGDRLGLMLRYAADATPFWRDRLGDLAGKDGPYDWLDALRRMPFTTKSDLLADQADHPPFGSYVATERQSWVRFFATSGTTGVPLNRVFSARDWQLVLDRFRRRRVFTADDVGLVLAPTDGLMGPTASLEAMAAAGALAVAAGRWGTSGKLRLLAQLRPDFVSGATSYLMHMADVAQDEGIDLAALGVRVLTSVGEPGAAVPATRDRIETAWGARLIDGYGMTEFFPLGNGCPHQPGIHIAGDMVLAELIDPETHYPVAPGQPGELVLTNLVGDTQPILRYRTGDIARAAPFERCACGFRGLTLECGIEGRRDDMIWYRGSNLYPSAVEAVLLADPSLGSAFEIRVNRQAPLPELTIVAELRDDTAPDTVHRRVSAALKSALRVAPRLDLVPPGSLEQPAGAAKARRVVRTGPAARTQEDEP